MFSFPQSLEKLGRILSFPFQVGWGSSQFQLNHRTQWPWPISGLHQLVDSQLAVTFQSLLIGCLCNYGKAFLLAENHQASEPAPGGGGGSIGLAKGWVSRDWLKFGFSWLQSPFSVYQGDRSWFPSWSARTPAGLVRESRGAEFGIFPCPGDFSAGK